MKSNYIPVIDVFSGPGGLAEGFSAFGYEKGARHFEVNLSIEKDAAAHSTLELRCFFRQFQLGEAPPEYYAFLRGEITRASLLRRFPFEASEAQKRVWKAELGSDQVSEKELDARVKEAIGSSKKWVLIGGPPCQAYSIAGRSRYRGVKGYKPEKDPRHFLYHEYLRVLGRYWPPMFVMENVQGIISSRVHGHSIFEKIISDLSDPFGALASRKNRQKRHRYRIYSLVKPAKAVNLFGYPTFSPSDYIIQSEKYGIPQSRHRLILLGVRDDLKGIEAPILTEKPAVPAQRVLQGLPRVRSGLSREEDSPERWRAALKEALSRRWLQGARKKAGEEVYRLIQRKLTELNLPRNDRGGEFIPCEVDISHDYRWYIDPKLKGVCNHSTKAHMKPDLHRYLYAASYAKIRKVSPKLADFPPDLLPDHRNVPFSMGHDNFTDRFRVQVYSRPATTITSHISKDGHYYIHPDPSQCRSLTVREAARLQTFPDNYFFCGDRTPQYVQVGNAVPPLLAMQIAEVVYNIFSRAGIED